MGLLQYLSQIKSQGSEALQGGFNELRNTGSGILRYLGNQAKQYEEPTPELRPRDFTREVKLSLQKIGQTLVPKPENKADMLQQMVLNAIPMGRTEQISKNIGKSLLNKVDDVVEPLLQEARKYKSAEEFVKAQPKLYHSGTANIKKVNLNKTNFNKTFYLSDKPEYAKSFGGKNSQLNELVLDNKVNLVDMRKPSNELVLQIEKIARGTETGKSITIPKPDGTTITLPTTPKDSISFSPYSINTVIQGIKDGKAYFAELPEVKKILQKLGYDGQITSEVPYAKNIGVWNKDIIKTKFQLIDIWNKANK